MTATFEFLPEERVRIVALEHCPAIVRIARLHPGGYRDYLVAYWHEGRRLEEWLGADELSTAGHPPPPNPT